MAHQWTVKGRWYIYGAYVHRDDQCTCGCVRRVFINEDGREWTEFYTMDENVTTSAPECPKARYKNKSKKRGNDFRNFTTWKPH